MRVICSIPILLAMLVACAATDDFAGEARAGYGPERCEVASKTGSRIGRKTCKTELEWKQSEIDAREAQQAQGRTPGSVFSDHERVDIRE